MYVLLPEGLTVSTGFSRGRYSPGAGGGPHAYSCMSCTRHAMCSEYNNIRHATLARSSMVKYKIL